MKAWIYMLLAIVTEVAGTLTMKYNADQDTIKGYLVMYFMLICSYSFLALAVKKIPMAVAYGAWESLGLMIIAILSSYLFAEVLSPTKMFAIVLLIIGIVLLEMGTNESTNTSRK